MQLRTVVVWHYSSWSQIFRKWCHEMGSLGGKNWILVFLSYLNHN